MGKKIQCIGRYVMEGQTLGKGTFARVELASHSITACKVAIKIIDTRKLKEEYMRNNLHREARILGQLRHPNIIRLYETLKIVAVEQFENNAYRENALVPLNFLDKNNCIHWHSSKFAELLWRSNSGNYQSQTMGNKV